MNYLPLYLMSLLETVFASLPAPVNVHVESLNFNHVLHWEPGPGTPPGTRYLVSKSTSRTPRLVGNLTTTSLRLKLKDVFPRFALSVEASYNGTLSPPGRVYFTPFRDTHLDPPQITLAEYSNCIKMNISLPEVREKIRRVYFPDFKITWKKHGDATMESFITRNKSVTLDNLTPGTEYCIQVTIETTKNKNLKPSDWRCIVTSMSEQRRVGVVAGTVSAVLIVLFSAVTIIVFSLHYTGFICKLKAAMPRFMTMALIQGYTLTPERTIPDHISVSSETDSQINRPTIPQPAFGGAHSDDEDVDEEEEEDENQDYVNRDVELSSGIGSCQESCDISGSSKPLASVDSGNMSDRMSAEMEVEKECDAQDEAEEESLISARSQTGDTNEEEEVETKEVCENSGGVNLFSVTLAALDVHKEEEEEEEDEEEEEEGDRNFLKSDLEFLPFRDNKYPQGHIDSQTETQLDDVKASDFNETGYEGKRTDTWTYNIQNCQTQREEEEEGKEEEEEEEEEEVEFSEYMSHR